MQKRWEDQGELSRFSGRYWPQHVTLRWFGALEIKMVEYWPWVCTADERFLLSIIQRDDSFARVGRTQEDRPSHGNRRKFKVKIKPFAPIKHLIEVSHLWHATQRWHCVLGCFCSKGLWPSDPTKPDQTSIKNRLFAHKLHEVQKPYDREIQVITFYSDGR